MRGALVLVGMLVLVVSAAVLAFIPLSVPSEICHAVAGWERTAAGAKGALDHPMGLAWRDGYLYVAEPELGAIRKISATTGAVEAEWRSFKRPLAVSSAPDGTLLIADFITDEIVRLHPDGTIAARWGRHGIGPGEIDAASGVAADAGGAVYVADFYNHRIQKFTPTGGFIVQWGDEGRWSGQFRYPTDVAIGAAGDVFVVDAYNHRVQKFTADGAYLAKWGGTGYGLSGQWAGWFRLAKSVVVDGSGSLYVADAFNHRLQKFSPDGQLAGTWGHPSTGALLRYPAGVAAGEDKMIYVSDFFEGRIWKLECT